MDEKMRFEPYDSAGVKYGRKFKRLMRLGKKELPFNLSKAQVEWVINEADPFLLAFWLLVTQLHNCESDQRLRVYEQIAMLMVEWSYKEHGCPTIFLDDPDFVQWLSVQNAVAATDDFKFPWPSFSLRFPKGLAINTVRLRGCLYNFNSRSTEIDSLRKLIDATCEHFSGVVENCVSFNPDRWMEFENFHDVNSVFQVSEVQHLYCNCLRDIFVDALSGDEVYYSGVTSAVTDLLSEITPTHDRIIASLLIYLQGVPDALVPGFPDGMNKPGDRVFSVNGSVMHKPLNVFRCRREESIVGDRSVSGHLRRGSWACLRAERFTKGGEPRWIYRRACVVGKNKLDPYTVKGLEEQVG